MSPSHIDLSMKITLWMTVPACPVSQVGRDLTQSTVGARRGLGYTIEIIPLFTYFLSQ
jgi:hypothetical protein